MKQKLRISCKPEEAEIAIKHGVEFFKDKLGNWLPVGTSGGWLSTETLQAMGATFEKELPEVGDGKEYEYKKGDECSGPKPEGTLVYIHTSQTEGWADAYLGPNGRAYWAQNLIYAIPLKKSCVVEGTVGTHPLFDGMCAIVPHDSFEYQQKVYILPKEGTHRCTGIGLEGGNPHNTAVIISVPRHLHGKRVEVLVREVQ